MTPYVEADGATIYHGDVQAVLRELPDESVDCVLSSPPYWRLRDYGEDEQLGLEATPEQYVENLTAVFREVRRLLRPHGTFWLNVGDAFDTKNLIGLPWMLAFALRADGWILRSEIIWAKGVSFCETYSGSTMPESARDRPTKAHEQVFLLTKSPRYFYDQEAIREPTGYGATPAYHAQRRLSRDHQDDRPSGANRVDYRNVEEPGFVSTPGGRNVRSVWAINPENFTDAHFATMPTKLAEACVLAGAPEFVCVTCGKPRERIVETTTVERDELPPSDPRYRPGRYVSARSTNVHDGGNPGMRYAATETLGWTDCGHANFEPGRVLDPFMGSGTTLLVARRHGRHGIGIDLNEEYCEIAGKRLSIPDVVARTAEKSDEPTQLLLG